MSIAPARNAALLVVAAALSWASFAAEAQGPPPRGDDPRIEQVRAAEIAFAASVAARDRAAFASFVAEDAVFVSGMEATRGRDAVVESWSGFFAADGPTIEWHPVLVEITADGTVGLTRGPWTLKGRNAKGESIEQHGIFNSVWRLQADGSWKVTFDAGCSPCPVCGG